MTVGISSPFETDTLNRSHYIGASECFELMAEKQYGRGCPRALAYRKLGTQEDIPSASTRDRAMSMRALFARGQRLEEYVSQFFMETTGRTLIRRSRLIRHPDYPGAGTHVDRIVLKGNGKPTGIAEIKTHAESIFLNICRNGLPPAHNLQLQFSMFCSGHPFGIFIILGIFGPMPLKYFEMERDEELMKIFAIKVEQFWNALAKGQLPDPLPDPKDIRCKVCPYRVTCRGEMLDSQDYYQLIAEREGRKTLTPIEDDELDQALADRALIKSEIEALDSDDPEDPGAWQIVTARIKQMLGDRDAVIVNKHWKVYCHQNTYSGIDGQRLREEQPEIYKRYYINRRPTGGKSLRVFAMHDGNSK